MADIKGIVGEKLGMTQIFVETRAVPVTVIKAGPCVVTQMRTQERDGYDAVQLAYGSCARKTSSSPPRATSTRRASSRCATLVELRTDDAGTYETGQEVTADLFAVGDKVDVVGVSKGKGFSGVMKRHGFAGLGGGHGVHKKHRSPGAIGACATPSRVFKGMRMAGHAGNQRTTVLNLEVVQADPERGLLLDQGRRARPQRRARDGALGREDPAEGTDGEGSVSMATRSTSWTPPAPRPARATCPPTIFEAPVNVPLMHQVVVAAMAGQRAGTHKVKTRGEVRGGGKKPWRQKGTGRARQGSIRSPQWVGGGVAHGPVVRDHNQRINKKMVKGALRSALDRRAGERQAHRGRRARRSRSPRPSRPPSSSTRSAARAACCSCCASPTEASRRREVVPQPPDGQVRPTRGGLGTYDVLLADHVVFTGEALDALGRRG